MTDIAPDHLFPGQRLLPVRVELATVRMQGAEDTDLNILFAYPPEYGAGGSPEQGVEECPVVVEEGPQQMGHGESNVLPVAVGKNMALLRYPLLGGFETAGAAGF